MYDKSKAPLAENELKTKPLTEVKIYQSQDGFEEKKVEETAAPAADKPPQGGEQKASTIKNGPNKILSTCAAGAQVTRCAYVYAKLNKGCPRPEQ